MAVAVTAMMGTEGKASRREEISRYAGRKSGRRNKRKIIRNDLRHPLVQQCQVHAAINFHLTMSPLADAVRFVDCK